MQWAGGDQVVEQTGRLQKVDEERHLARWRDRCVRVPVDVDAPGISVDWHWMITRELNQWLLTFRVRPEDLGSFHHAQKNAGDSREMPNSNAGFSFMEPAGSGSSNEASGSPRTF